jgi:Uma2 family endonuclease
MNIPITISGTEPGQVLASRPIIYPDSDGQPMAENTLQFRWIVTIEGGLEAVYRHDSNVFVAGDLLWYPVEGEPSIRIAPDALVVFGRPKGDRGSYQQWRENNISPQVVFEVLSPGNRFGEMLKKFKFYERYGVEEYYLYDPDRGDFAGWLRSGGKLEEIPSLLGWISPRLQVRFEMVNGELQLFGPDGRKFASYIELVTQQEQERFAKEEAQRQAEQARQQAEQARQQAEQARQQAEQLAAQLKALGIEPKW